MAVTLAHRRINIGRGGDATPGLCQRLASMAASTAGGRGAGESPPSYRLSLVASPSLALNSTTPLVTR